MADTGLENALTRLTGMGIPGFRIGRDTYYLRIRYGTFRINAQDLEDICYVNPPCAGCSTGTVGTASDENSDAVVCPPRWFWDMLLQYVYDNADNPLLSTILATLATYGPPCMSALNNDCEIYDCVFAASSTLALYVQARWDAYVATGQLGDVDENDNTIPILIVRKGTLRFCGQLLSTRCADVPLCDASCNPQSDGFSGG